MNETKHTPGPWERINLTICTQSTRELPCLIIARVYEAGLETQAADSPEQATANARLIAAAPDLLEACNSILPFLKDLVKRPRSSASAQRIGADAEDALGVVDAAIAKARPA